MSEPGSWTTQRTTSPDDLETEILVVTRHEPLPLIRLEIHGPGLPPSAGDAQNRIARNAIKHAVRALEEALDSSALPGHIERHAWQI